MKLKKGDNVVVIAGKNKGKTGKVLRILQKNNRIVVEGVNKVTRHVRKTKQQAGQKVEFEAPMHISNVMVTDGEAKKRVRVGYKVDAKGIKTRIGKQNGKVIDHIKK